ncbi:unnamed protein product [Porites lobata]|uniref:CTHRC1 C-terminal domain-containing protein n=1 Tax=Porites lobata TaxID=104759 RepID=A0ABN8PWL9_9CNID|nr:unnamed protein product [Porites lobata]
MPGPRGDRGRVGPPGRSGPPTILGIKGEPGLVGMRGERSIVRNQGRERRKHQSKSSKCSTTNQLQTMYCAFKKLKSDAALQVSFHGTVRVHGDDKCNRWYFKFNGNECSG